MSETVFPSSVYKVAPRAEWSCGEAGGLYRGSADDARDGFIHLATMEHVHQLPEGLAP